MIKYDAIEYQIPTRLYHASSNHPKDVPYARVVPVSEVSIHGIRPVSKCLNTKMIRCQMNVVEIVETLEKTCRK